MMLAHQCSARAYLIILIAVLLSVFLLTAHRLHIGSSLNLPQLADRPVTKNPEVEKPKTQPEDAQAQAPTKLDDFCNNDWKFLRSKELGLSDKVIYTRRCVKPTYGNVNRDAVGKIADPLISGTTTLNMKADCAQFTLPPCQPLDLEVPRPYPPHADQYGHLAFGIASNYERVEKSLSSFAHWMAGTGAQLVAVISDADDGNPKHNLRALETLYRDSGINATIIAPKLKESLPRKDHKEEDKLSRPAAVEQLHFLLIRDLLDISTPQTQWLGVLDDDTFFPALDPLSRKLREYDHTRSFWLGALGDNWFSVKSWGFMAYGGAGTFLSMPLAKQLEPELENCVRETTIKTGDGMLRDCVYQRSSTKLTLVDGLYQHDIRGNPAGFFESGRRALSLHHWKSWYKAPVVEMAAVAKVCGDCFLQRWRFAKDTLLANGYSITVYREGLDQLDLTLMEGTFDNADERFDFTYGPFRPRLGNDQKKSYRLLGVDGGTAKGDHFRQAFVHRARRDEEGIEPVDEVIELVWEV